MRKEKFMVGDIVRLKNKELKLKIDSMNDDGTCNLSTIDETKTSIITNSENLVKYSSNPLRDVIKRLSGI